MSTNFLLISKATITRRLIGVSRPANITVKTKGNKHPTICHWNKACGSTSGNSSQIPVALSVLLTSTKNYPQLSCFQDHVQSDPPFIKPPFTNDRNMSRARGCTWTVRREKVRAVFRIPTFLLNYRISRKKNTFSFSLSIDYIKSFFSIFAIFTAQRDRADSSTVRWQVIKLIHFCRYLTYIAWKKHIQEEFHCYFSRKPH